MVIYERKTQFTYENFLMKTGKIHTFSLTINTHWLVKENHLEIIYVQSWDEKVNRSENKENKSIKTQNLLLSL